MRKIRVNVRIQIIIQIIMLINLYHVDFLIFKLTMRLFYVIKKEKNDRRKHFKICKQSSREHFPKTQAKASSDADSQPAHRFMHQRGGEPALSHARPRSDCHRTAPPGNRP